MKILISELEYFPKAALNILSKLGDVKLFDVERKQLLDEIHDVNILWVRLRTQIDKEVLDAAPNLQLLVTPTTGLNHIDLEETNSRGVKVLSLKGETEFLKEIRGTAEHTIALMLSLIRNLPEAVGHTKSGNWNRDIFRGTELYEKTIGILGYGRLGKIVTRYLTAFGSNVIVYDPNIGSSVEDPNIDFVDKEYLLSNSNIVTLHVNYTKANHQYFNKSYFDMMKPGSYFVNTSRGELVDENALLEALISKKLRGAAIDVLADENMINFGQNSLVKYSNSSPNLIITPHIGGCTFESIEKVEIFMAERVRKWLRNSSS